MLDSSLSESSAVASYVILIYDYCNFLDYLQTRCIMTNSFRCTVLTLESEKELLWVSDDDLRVVSPSEAVTIEFVQTSSALRFSHSDALFSSWYAVHRLINAVMLSSHFADSLLHSFSDDVGLRLSINITTC